MPVLRPWPCTSMASIAPPSAVVSWSSSFPCAYSASSTWHVSSWTTDLLGLNFLPLKSSLQCTFWVWLMMGRTQVIDWQTSSILESLEATPPAALVVCSRDSSNFGSSSCLSSSSRFLTKVWRLNLGQVCPICQPCRLVLRNRYKVKHAP